MIEFYYLRNRKKKSVIWDFITQINPLVGICNIYSVTITLSRNTTNTRTYLKLHIHGNLIKQKVVKKRASRAN